MLQEGGGGGCEKTKFLSGLQNNADACQDTNKRRTYCFYLMDQIDQYHITNCGRAK
jgi:hypothetical protein